MSASSFGISKVPEPNKIPVPNKATVAPPMIPPTIPFFIPDCFFGCLLYLSLMCVLLSLLFSSSITDNFEKIMNILSKITFPLHLLVYEKNRKKAYYKHFPVSFLNCEEFGRCDGIGI